MLPFFPSPYDNELLYSVFARYHKWSQNKSYKDTVSELFGCRTACAVVDLPSRLLELYERLPDGSMNTPHRVIEENTLFPLYRPFLSKDRVNSILREMEVSSVNGCLHTTSGIMASKITPPAFLRYCPQCIEDDEKSHGEPYWHRTHQFFGVHVCPYHKIPLFESNIAISSPQNKHAFIALDNNITNERKLSVFQSEFENYLVIASDVYWLLNNHVPVHGLKELHNRYIYYLQKNDLATYNGRVKQQELIPAFQHYFGIQFLNNLISSVDYEKQDNWLNKLVRKPRTAAHPLRHILLMRFLGVTPEEFLCGRKKQYLPFGKGPWPCLNKAASHYRQRVINECCISHNYDTGTPVGTFYCKCGFIYCRRGPDQKKEDKNRFNWVQSFGWEWEKKLYRLAKVENRGLREIGRLLDVDPGTIKNHLEHLQWQGKEDKSIYKHKLSLLEKRERYRANWLKITANNPDKTKTELRQLAQAEYTWLYRHDYDWLSKNSPALTQQKKYEDKRVDWDRRDEELADKVMTAAKELLNCSKPVRLNISSIGKKIGQLALLQKHLSKLPKTKAALENVIESIEDFQIRRVWYVAENLHKQGEEIQEWKIIRKAGLRPGYSEKVKKEIMNAISEY